MSNLIMELEGLHEEVIKLSIGLNLSEPYDEKFVQSLDNIINVFEIDRANQARILDILPQQGNIIIIDQLIKNEIKDGFIDTKEPIPNNPSRFVYLEAMVIQLGKAFAGGIFGLHANRQSDTRFTIERAELLQPICSYESISDDDLNTLYEASKARFENENENMLIVTRRL